MIGEIKVEENHQTYANGDIDLDWNVWIFGSGDNCELALSIMRLYDKDYYQIVPFQYGEIGGFNPNPWAAVLADEIQKEYGTYIEAESAIKDGITAFHDHLHE